MLYIISKNYTPVKTNITKLKKKKLKFYFFSFYYLNILKIISNNQVCLIAYIQAEVCVLSDCKSATNASYTS